MVRTRPAPPLIVTVLALAAALPAGCAGTARSDPGATIVAATSVSTSGVETRSTRSVSVQSITDFAPAEPNGDVDLEGLSMMRVFDEIGEHGSLWYQHVQTLANPYFEGRVDGSAGMDRARDYIEFHFRLCGLEPAFPAADGDDDAGDDRWQSYRQPFEFQDIQQMRVRVRDSRVDLDGRALEEGEDYVVFGNSASGSVSGPVTFVGYGIEEGEGGYSSFDDDSDLSGRVALLLRYEPLDEQGASRWAERRFSPHASMERKMEAVQRRGAEAILLVNPPESRDGRSELERRLRRFARRQLDVPVVQISAETAGRLLDLADAEGRDLLAWRRLADEGAVTTVDLDETVTVAIETELERSGGAIPAANMGGVLRGSGDLADEWLVIGGHYDHNGYGWFGTTPDQGPLFPGADDNASGTAGVLVLARRFAETYEGYDGDKRSVLFITFDAEERGLHGSRHYTQNPTLDPRSITALLNMDMIGRLRTDKLLVLGTGTGRGLSDLLDGHFAHSGLSVTASLAGSGRSDDANFHRIEVPALHFFTGMHPEYTSPADLADTVNPVGAAKVIDLVYEIGLDLATRGRMLAYTDPAADAGQDRGYGRVRLGIRPGMGADLETGILVDGVSEGTSAAEGGVQSGDVLLWWDDTELDSMQTLMEKLQTHEPGDRVTLTVRRDGRNVELNLTLKASER